MQSERQENLKNWLVTTLGETAFSLEPASSDASFRRYFRVKHAGKSLIVMDAPTQHEDCRPFIKVAGILKAAQVHIPEILSQNLEQGFLLLSDLGNTTYLDALNDESAHTLYMDAISALIKIQLASQPGILPEYDSALLLREMNLFPDWYIAKELSVDLDERQAAELQKIFALLIENNLAQGKVYVHRDYHSRNLMVTEPNPGILDFQDAVYGPITYDLMSLFKDAYINWGEERRLDWVIRYWEQAKRAGLPVTADFADFYRDFEWMGIQRHLKVIGIFARLCHRDGKEVYLKSIPLVMDYLWKACERYKEFTPLLRLLDHLAGKTQLKTGYTF
jgi:aminoglycoside/choline kinase family phosphotransferase